MITKNMMKHTTQPGISLEFRAPCINGHVDSYHESTDFNSRNQIDSFNHMNSPSSPPKKKDSIYKTALQKSNSQKIIGVKLMQSEVDSIYSGASSKEDVDTDNDPKKSPDQNSKSHQHSREGSTDHEQDRNLPKKSRFGRDV